MAAQHKSRIMCALAVRIFMAVTVNHQTINALATPSGCTVANATLCTQLGTVIFFIEFTSPSRASLSLNFVGYALDMSLKFEQISTFQYFLCIYNLIWTVADYKINIYFLAYTMAAKGKLNLEEFRECNSWITIFYKDLLVDLSQLWRHHL